MARIDANERARRRIEDRVRRFMDDNVLWPDVGPLVVAVSGGPDSTALLLILSRLAARRGLELVAAHFDHGLRPPEARVAERIAVEALATGLGVELKAGEGDVRALAREKKLSTEDAARRARYGFLADVAAGVGASAVATGHTASDQAETVLLHVIRGSGLRGLAGMKARAPWPVERSAVSNQHSAGDDGEMPDPSGRRQGRFRAAPTQNSDREIVEGGLALTRPLLCLSRAETEAYCALAGVMPIEDETNASAAYTRNRVRHEVLPLLRELNPRVEEALVRLSDAAAAPDIAESEFFAGSRGATGEIRLDRALDIPADKSALHADLARALEQLLGDRSDFTAKHFGSLDRLLTQGRTGDSLDLPRGVRARLDRDALVLSTAAHLTEALPDQAVTITIPGQIRFGPLTVCAGDQHVEDGLCLDAEATGSEVTVRKRRSGDRFQPSGMSGTKKLQDFFVDRHIPRSERDLIPIFENERGILAVGDIQVAEWARPRAGEPAIALAYHIANSSEEA